MNNYPDNLRPKDFDHIYGGMDLAEDEQIEAWWEKGDRDRINEERDILCRSRKNN